MNLDILPEQKMVLSANMQLSLNILKMSNEEVCMYLQEQSCENPLIEVEPNNGQEIKYLEKLRRLRDMDCLGYTSYPDDRDGNLFYEGEQKTQLSDELLYQLPSFPLSEALEKRVRYLISCLDERGYLSCSKQQLLTDMSLNKEQLQEALSVLHEMEPLGVGAEDLKECLLIQARHLFPENNVLPALIDNINILAKSNYSKLSSIIGLPVEDIRQGASLLISLNPKPGNGFGLDNTLYVRPDMFVTQQKGVFEIVFNEDMYPRIEINKLYSSMASGHGKEMSDYVEKQLGKAAWLISSLDRRKNTIIKCGKAIAGRQQRFFHLGPGSLETMTLSDIAEDIGMHTSTVSRCISGKYLQCRWGTFALGELFSAGNPKESHSRDFIMEQIKKIISEEAPEHPLSDQAISDILSRRGINIARRTVAKYRDLLKIPAAPLRRPL